jgi:hypothetical protein
MLWRVLHLCIFKFDLNNHRWFPWKLEADIQYAAVDGREEKKQKRAA